MSAADTALSVIEAHCGRSFGRRQVCDLTPLIDNHGRLPRGPVLSVDAVSVRAADWQYSNVFGASDWREFAPSEWTIINSTLVVEGGFFDGHYTEANVSYTIGYSELPAAIAQARDLVAQNLTDGASKYAASTLITPEISALLEPFIEGGDAI